MSLLDFLLAALALFLGLRFLGTRKILADARRHVPRTGFRPDLESPEAAEPGETLVVFVHGTFCDAPTQDLWRRSVEAEGYPVWLFEYRYLESVVINARRLDQDLQARLDELGARTPERLVVVGYSQGGLLLRWLLSGRARKNWVERVVGFLQVASPNRGCEPADLCKLFWSPGSDPASPALEQLRPGSRMMQVLGERSLREGLRYGVVYGVGPGRGVLGRFWAGRPEGNRLTRALGRLYEWLFLCPRANDGLVSVESALALYRERPELARLAPRRVDNDHLGLLVDPRVAEILPEMLREILLAS